MEKERRKVDYVNGEIQLLKPNGKNGDWHSIGRTVKSLRSLDSMIKDGVFDFQITEEVMRNLSVYREEERIRRKPYLSQKQYNLKSQ